MKIENREQNQGIVGEHKGGGRSIRDDGNETTPGEVIYRLSVSHHVTSMDAAVLHCKNCTSVHTQAQLILMVPNQFSPIFCIKKLGCGG